MIGRIIILTLLMFSFSFNLFAKEEHLDRESKTRYCDELELGWHFYCDEEEIQEVEKPQPQNQVIAPKELTPYEEVLKIREKLQNLHAQTLLEPTEENIYNYEKFKLEQIKRVSYTTQATQRLYWKNPELNYLLKRPTSTIGKRNWLDDRNANIKSTIADLNKNYGLIYFFRSDCSVCAKFSPLLKDFTQRNNINIRAISVNGQANKTFPNAKMDRGESANLDVRVVPTLFLFNSKTKEISPIGSGFMAMDTLEERIYLLTKVKVGDDY